MTTLEVEFVTKVISFTTQLNNVVRNSNKLNSTINKNIFLCL
jgi:hypothetical protein